MKQIIRGSLIFLFAARLTIPVMANELTGEIPTWTKKGMLRGASSTEQECIRPDRVWVHDEKTGYCIRYFKNQASPADGVAIFFFSGDYVGSDWDEFGQPIRATYGGGEGIALFRSIKRLTKSSKNNLLLVVSRPGQLGSSGDHKEKYKRHESRVMNAAIDQIKSKYNVNEVVLAGHSGGATLVANLLSKRSDVSCAVMGSGAIALGEFAYDSGFAPDIWGTWQDPMVSVKKIAPSPAEYYILAGQGDTIRPPKYQKMYADALAAGGLNVHFLVLRKRGDARDHQDEVLKVVDECAKRRSFEQIKRQLNVSKSQ